MTLYVILPTWLKYSSFNTNSCTLLQKLSYYKNYQNISFTHFRRQTTIKVPHNEYDENFSSILSIQMCIRDRSRIEVDARIDQVENNNKVGITEVRAETQKKLDEIKETIGG